MSEIRLDLRGLKCPLPALKTKKALSRMRAGEELLVECTDPLSGIDIPNLLRDTGDTLIGSRNGLGLLVFHIRKK
jgi:tRNA 2-thiouridine synthesizing protein A